MCVPIFLISHCNPFTYKIIQCADQIHQHAVLKNQKQSETLI
jgi:hypothetical protein